MLTAALDRAGLQDAASSRAVDDATLRYSVAVVVIVLNRLLGGRLLQPKITRRQV